MREIKFRAWDKLENKMRPKFGMFAIPDWTEPMTRPEQVHVMQFTGLHDKNGKEIYEGDCLRSIENDEVYQIGYLVPMSRNAHYDYCINIGFFGEDNKYNLRSVGGRYFEDDLLSWSEMYEVIGNIYENPELLT